MASNAKKTTFAKLNRENAVRERRQRKQARRQARKQAPPAPSTPAPIQQAHDSDPPVPVQPLAEPTGAE